MSRQRTEREAAAPVRASGRSETVALHIVVFVCGAVLMAFEMAGSRILAPTFGNTIFVWGSLIGVFLAALSLGYLVGGRLADRVPRFLLLGAVIAVAGLVILAVPLFAAPASRWIDKGSPGSRFNPLFASMLFFFVPSVLLGMVSPFSVRLQAQSVATMGNVAGRLYSLSTLGSIAGTMIATFWFIPTYGTANIVRALGIALVLVSLLAIIPGLRARVKGTYASLRLAGMAVVVAGLIGFGVATPWLLRWGGSSFAALLTTFGVCAALVVLSTVGLILLWRAGAPGKGICVVGLLVGVSFAGPLLVLCILREVFRLGGWFFVSPKAAGVLSDAAPFQIGIVALSMLALLVWLSLRWGWGLTTTIAGIFGAAGLLSPASPSYLELDEGEKLVAEMDSPYQHIGVALVSRSYGGDEKQWSLRMIFDKYIESEVLVEDGDLSNIRLKEPYESGAKYTDTLHIPFLFNKDARSVLIVGGGGGVVPTIFRRDYPQLEAIDVVEIDPVVLQVAEKYFGFRPGKNGVATHLVDGRVYVRDCTRQYDIIILDAFTGGRPPFHLLTQEFLRLVKARLGPRGVAHLNIISALEGDKSKLFWAMLKTFHSVFGKEHVYAFPKLYDPRWGVTRDRTDGMNIELVALNFDDFENPLPKAAIEARARDRVGTLIKIPAIARHAENYQTMDDLLCRTDPSEKRRRDREREWSHAAILTDDYAPVDNWVND